MGDMKKHPDLERWNHIRDNIDQVIAQLIPVCLSTLRLYFRACFKPLSSFSFFSYSQILMNELIVERIYWNVCLADGRYV
jgi:hypothetical protein